ncbi:MAG: Holliday junction branch migration protein RuvA [Mariprofundaceae bacterium]|nr:Holliday junction branch migration protein RuvA [Mariprofundaceae bacterium]
MIGWLSGEIRELDPIGSILLDVHGVGYDITVSLQTLSNLQIGQAAELSIHTHVREDQFLLFGFASSEERSLFRQLNKVTGIGARMALNLMSSMSSSELTTAVEQSDDLAIARTPGIGKKTAQRLILELQGKLQDSSNTNTHSPVKHHLQDVKSALLNLGYKSPAIDKSLSTLDASLGFEVCFKHALKQLS